MRTDGFINLSLLANKFDGGGHKNASGFSFDGNIDYLKKLLRERILYEQQNPTLTNIKVLHQTINCRN